MMFLYIIIILISEHCENRDNGSEEVFPYLDGAVALVEYLKEQEKEVRYLN